MSWPEDIAHILSAVAWPAVIFGIAFLFRSPLETLLLGLRQVRWRELRAEFGRDLELGHEIASETESLPLPKTAQDPAPAAKKSFPPRSAKLSPRTVVLNSWSEVEAAARKLLNGHAFNEDLPRLPSVAPLGDALAEGCLIDDARFQVFTILSSLHDRVQREPDFAITPRDALNYAVLARRLVAALSDAGGKNDRNWEGLARGASI
jgi:hypothetical protein